MGISAISASPEFLEKLVLLVVTAGLTGFLVPFVLKRVDDRKARDQKVIEALLARQAKLIEAQASFLDEIARALWDWRYCLMKVTYFGSLGLNKEYEAAAAEYRTALWPLLSKFRFLASRARYLVSDATYIRLRAYYQQIIERDKVLMQACLVTDPIQQQLLLGDINAEVFETATRAIDDLLHDIAVEVRLAAPASLRHDSPG